MKKIICLLLCLTLAAPLLFSCNTAEEKKEADTTADTAVTEEIETEVPETEEIETEAPETEAPETSDDPYPDPDTTLPTEDQIRQYLSQYVLLHHDRTPVLYCFGDDMTVYTYGNNPTEPNFRQLTACASYTIENERVIITWWNDGSKVSLAYTTAEQMPSIAENDPPSWKKISALDEGKHFLYEADFDPLAQPTALLLTTYSSKEVLGIN